MPDGRSSAPPAPSHTSWPVPVSIVDELARRSEWPLSLSGAIRFVRGEFEARLLHEDVDRLSHEQAPA